MRRGVPRQPHAKHPARPQRCLARPEHHSGTWNALSIIVASSLEYHLTRDDILPLLAFSINNISVYPKSFSQTRHNREQRYDYLSPVLHPALPRSTPLTVPIPVNARRKQVDKQTTVLHTDIGHTGLGFLCCDSSVSPVRVKTHD